MKTTSIMVLAALVAGGLLLSAGMVGADGAPGVAYGPYHTNERHELMEKAFEEKDYEAWKVLMTEGSRRPRVVDVVTEDNFDEFAAAHEAKEAGELEKAAAIRAELGLGQGRGKGYGRGYGRGMRGAGFVDEDGDGQCDNLAAGGCGGCGRGRGGGYGRGMGRGWRFQQLAG